MAVLSLVFCKINKNPEEMEQKLNTFSSVAANTLESIVQYTEKKGIKGNR